MPLRENCADRQAAAAVRARIAGKSLLRLELTDPGCDFSVLSACRDRLLAGSAAELLLDKLRERCRAMGWLKARGQQRTDSTPVLAALRVLTRLALVAETLRAALNAVATTAPDWLHAVTPLAWYERSRRRIEASRLPQDTAAREAYAHTVGEDGFRFLALLETPEAPAGLRELPHMEALRRTWQRHDERPEEAPAAAEVPAVRQGRCQEHRALPPAAAGIASPYDVEARYRQKRDTTWTRSLVHVRETCEPTAPHLLTHVHTTPATGHAAQCTESMQQALIAKEGPPREHLVDAASISSELLVRSRDAPDMIRRGPTRPSQGGQAQGEGAYGPEPFVVDWDQQQVRCPQGHLSTAWWEHGGGQGSRPILVQCATQTCAPCPVRAACTRAKRRGRRLGLPPRAEAEAVADARTWYARAAGKTQYGQRAGIAGTLSQGVRAFGLRRTR
jgi:hypothetical protein